MGKLADMTGQIFENLTVLKFSCIKNSNAHWLCKCGICGKETEVSRPNLKSGNTVDCGCKRSEKISEAKTTHGLSKTPTWNSWAKMHRRIVMGEDHSSIYSKITINTSWDDFEVFLQDMGERPIGKTLDRINNTKGYFKENCRWATQAEQNRNRSTNVMLNFNGKTMCAIDWASHLCIHRDTIRRRIKKGLPIDKILAIK